MDSKANLPPADLCLEQAVSYNRLVITGFGATVRMVSVTSQEKERSPTSQVCWVDFVRQVKIPGTEPSIMDLKNNSKNVQ